MACTHGVGVRVRLGARVRVGARVRFGVRVWGILRNRWFFGPSCFLITTYCYAPPPLSYIE